MKTNRSIFPLLWVLVSAILPVAGYVTKAKASETILPPSNATVAITVTTAEPPTPVQFTAADSAAPTRWKDIEDCTSEMRDSFFAGLARLNVTLNTQIDELTALRASMTEATGIKTLDLAIREMRNARFSLKLMGDKLSKATAPTWDRQKSNIGLAWGKSQAAYIKGKIRTII